MSHIGDSQVRSLVHSHLCTPSLQFLSFWLLFAQPFLFVHVLYALPLFLVSAQSVQTVEVLLLFLVSAQSVQTVETLLCFRHLYYFFRHQELLQEDQVLRKHQLRLPTFFCCHNITILCTFGSVSAVNSYCLRHTRKVEPPSALSSV